MHLSATDEGLPGQMPKFHLKKSQQNNVRKSQNESERKGTIFLRSPSVIVDIPRNFLRTNCSGRSRERQGPLSAILYRPQTKFAKVMCSQVSVCPQGDLGLYPGGTPVPGRVSVQGVSVHRGVSVQGGLCLGVSVKGGLCQGDPSSSSEVVAHSGKSWMWIAINVCEYDGKILLRRVKIILMGMHIALDQLFCSVHALKSRCKFVGHGEGTWYWMARFAMVTSSTSRISQTGAPTPGKGT